MNDEEFGLVKLGLAALIAIFLTYAFFYYLFPVADHQYTDRVKDLFKEYNVGLDPVTCRSVLVTGVRDGTHTYYCTVDANVNLHETNHHIYYVARGNLLVVDEGNRLLLYKLEPYSGAPLSMNRIPEKYAEALLPITLVVDNKALCISSTGSVVSCYVPTNKAPLGKATILYAPLIDFTVQDGNIAKVVVHV